MFATLNETVKDTEVIPEKAKKNVNDSLNAGVSDINFTQYHEQVKYGKKVFIVKLIGCLMINLGMSFTMVSRLNLILWRKYPYYRVDCASWKIVIEISN